MLKVEGIFTKLNSAKYFPNLNLCARNHHIPLNEESILKTAFRFPFGKYEVPFGQAQAPAYFQELMNKLLMDLPFAGAYLDDILIYSKTAEDLDHLQQVFHKLSNAKLSMKLSKHHFFAKEIQYLGHVLSTTCIKPLPSKEAANKLMKSKNMLNR